MTQEVKVLIGIGLLTAFLMLGGVFLLSKSPGPTSAVTNADAKQLIKSESHRTGSESAQITIVEFGDYQCPACGAAFPVVEQILKDYPGKVNLVFRHFPLPQHQNEMIAAKAAEAAGEQGKFWEMHNLLYQNQSEWSESTKPLEVFSKYASQLNLDVTKFKADASSDKYNNRIQTDKTDGLSLGINSTPTFFVNGLKTSGYSYNEFKSKIEAFKAN